MLDGVAELHGPLAVNRGALGRGFANDGETAFLSKPSAPSESSISHANLLMDGRTSILIASTTWWAFPARIAMEAAARGLAVDVVCGPGHPLLKTASSRRRFRYAALRPLKSLERAIMQSGAALVIPCDDRTLSHLHLLHQRTQHPSLRKTIADSLGDAGSFGAVAHRADLIAIARSLGIEAPETLPVENAAELESAIEWLGLPVVLKVDGSWGGLGVAVARTRQQALDHFARLSRPLSAGQAIKRLLVDRDGYHLLPWLHGKKSHVSLQAYVPGRPANSVSVCRDGEILSTVCAEAVSVQRPLGASSVVRIIDNAHMQLAAEVLARHLKLSGVFGLDFLLDETTGVARLVEMNARATPLCHLRFGEGRDLIRGIAIMAGLKQAAAAPPVTEKDVVAYFPQAWHTAPDDPWLHRGFHDVPWEDPSLLRDLLQKPWPDRGALATLRRWLMQRVTPAPAATSTEPTMDMT